PLAILTAAEVLPAVPEAAAPVGPLGLDRGLDLLTLRLPGRPLGKRPANNASDMRNARIRAGPARLSLLVAALSGVRATSRPRTRRRDEAQSARAFPRWFESGLGLAGKCNHSGVIRFTLR